MKLKLPEPARVGDRLVPPGPPRARPDATATLVPDDRPRPRRVVRAHRDQGARRRGRARGRRRARRGSARPPTRWPRAIGADAGRARPPAAAPRLARLLRRRGGRRVAGATTRRPSSCARTTRTRCGLGAASSAATGSGTIWNELPTSVRTGGSGTEAAFGLEYFDLMQQRPETGAVFDAAMAAASRFTAPFVCAGLRLRGVHPRAATSAAGPARCSPSILTAFPRSARRGVRPPRGGRGRTGGARGARGRRPVSRSSAATSSRRSRRAATSTCSSRSSTTGTTSRRSAS